METVYVEECPACLHKDQAPLMQVKDYRAGNEVFALVRCSHCGLIITQNHPSESHITRYYETKDYISHSDRPSSAMDKVYYMIRRRMATRKQGWIERFAKGRTLIDVGAGTGNFAAHMQLHGWTVKGFEPSAAARKIAQSTHGLCLSEPDALFGEGNRTADVISMWHVLEHIHTPERYLLRIREILRDAGVLFLALPNYQSVDAKYYGAFWGAWDVPRHLWHFSPRAARILLDRMGFKLMHTYVLPFDAFYVALISEKYRGGGFLRMLRGMIIGILSSIAALFNKERASSIVYVCQKAKA